MRISRLQLAGEVMTGTEKVLVEDYCHQYPFHAGGGLEFGADGYLYVSGSDGSTAQLWDYGQTGTPLNPCGDPPGNGRHAAHARRRPRAAGCACRTCARPAPPPTPRASTAA